MREKFCSKLEMINDNAEIKENNLCYKILKNSEGIYPHFCILHYYLSFFNRGK